MPPPPPQSTVTIDHEKLQAIRDGMWMVVNAGGTGGRARIEGKDVCGKTGTAQVISNQGARRPREESARTCATTAGSCSSRRATTRKIAGVVFLEHGIHGPNAATVAHHILDMYFAKQDGQPLPLVPTHDDMHLDYKDPMARQALRSAGD